MLQEQIHLARAVTCYLFDQPDFEVLPTSLDTKAQVLARTYVIVLFRAKNDNLNKDLVQRINASAKMYVSGTAWEGKPACRIAISNWQANVERDSKIIMRVLNDIVAEHSGSTLFPSSPA